MEADGTLALSVDDAVHHSRPSIDVLFESAAAVHGNRVLGILLSGASSDGASGLALIRAAGGQTWVQDPETAAASVMPLAALALAPQVTATPEQMAQALAAWVAAGA